MLDWLIVGGGVHGTHLSLVLSGRGRVPRDRLRVLDPHETPLARWDACVESTGMTHLRSPFVHHIDVEPFALRTFSRSKEGRALGRPRGPYERPPVALFSAHTRATIARHALADLRVLGAAQALGSCEGGIRVETSRGAIEARRVVIAIGAGDAPSWPGWARALRASGAHVRHVFEPGFSDDPAPPGARVAVIGGGISAAQLALTLAERSPGAVTLVARHAPRVRNFDSDPEWIGPRRLDGFAQVRDLGERRRLIATARHRGSMPPDVASALRAAIQRGSIVTRTGSVTDSAALGPVVRLDLDDGRGPIDADRIVLATGFDPARPGGAWIDRAIADMGLACAACGYPIVDRALRWHPRIHVSGPLAELEIGPPARNIIGARMAAERLLGAA